MEEGGREGKAKKKKTPLKLRLTLMFHMCSKCIMAIINALDFQVLSFGENFVSDQILKINFKEAMTLKESGEGLIGRFREGEGRDNLNKKN